jgi:hypothetical protein
MCFHFAKVLLFMENKKISYDYMRKALTMVLQGVETLILAEEIQSDAVKKSFIHRKNAENILYICRRII